MARSASRRWQGWKRQVAQNDRVTKPGAKRTDKAKPFWLTIGYRDARCTSCAAGLAHKPLAYHHPSKQALCESCWTNRGLKPRESRRYREWLGKNTTPGAETSEGRGSLRIVQTEEGDEE